MLYLLGIDDTDQPGSGGTAQLALTLGKRFEELSLAQLVNISSHELLRSSLVECTSDNHAACLLLNSEPECGREIDLVCREFLRRASSPGANPGFALSAWSQLDSAIRAWGKAAKAIQLQRQDALELARKYSVSIAGFAGTGSGVIGALAAVGLRDDGSDGRFSWLPGLPGLRSRIYTFAEIMQVVAFDRVESERGMKPDLRERINIPEHTLPILRDGKSVLLLQPAKKNSPYAWDVVQEK